MDSHTMVKSGSEGAGTMRATSTMSDGAQTMIEHGNTMLESDLGTMVINSDDEEEEEDQGSMRSEHTGCWFAWRMYVMSRGQDLTAVWWNYITACFYQDSLFFIFKLTEEGNRSLIFRTKSVDTQAKGNLCLVLFSR